eukprot:gene10944-22848_t
MALETDYLGMLNFCLRSTDSALSAPSRSKVLNAVTNEVFKAVMIGHQPSINNVLSKMGAYRDSVKKTTCYLGDEDGIIPSGSVEQLKACDKDLKRALSYVDSLETLVVRGEVASEDSGGIYDRGYTRLVSQLKDMGCMFLSGGVRPIDSNICLSLLDENIMPTIKTKTRELNRIANWIPRAVIYGELMDRIALADSIDMMLKPFADEWLNGNMNAQEIMFLRALSLLLREGVAAAETAIMYYDNSSDKFGESNISGALADVMTIVAPPLRLFDPYLNSFQRIVSLCLRDLGSRYWTVPQDEEVLGTFSQWEQSLRSNITGAMWNQNPKELAGLWQMVDVQGRGDIDPFLASNGNTFPQGSGTGSSSSTMTPVVQSPTESDEVAIELCIDGSVNLSPSSAGTGHMWRFKPGPVHLDTCEFTVISNSEPGLVLQYVGYIDRGQRVECRFSGRSIRMTGRVQSYVKGVLRGSTRFVLAQQRTPTDTSTTTTTTTTQ